VWPHAGFSERTNVRGFVAACVAAASALGATERLLHAERDFSQADTAEAVAR
jgi:hypothetical protein